MSDEDWGELEQTYEDTRTQEEKDEDDRRYVEVSDVKELAKIKSECEEQIRLSILSDDIKERLRNDLNIMINEEKNLRKNRTIPRSVDQIVEEEERLKNIFQRVLNLIGNAQQEEIRKEEEKREAERREEREAERRTRRSRMDRSWLERKEQADLDEAIRRSLEETKRPPPEFEDNLDYGSVGRTRTEEDILARRERIAEELEQYREHLVINPVNEVIIDRVLGSMYRLASETDLTLNQSIRTITGHLQRHEPIYRIEEFVDRTIDSFYGIPAREGARAEP